MNDFIRARAVAIQAQIPGAIFRFASQDPDTLEQFFEGSSEFLPLTKQIYVSVSCFDRLCWPLTDSARPNISLSAPYQCTSLTNTTMGTVYTRLSSLDLYWSTS